VPPPSAALIVRLAVALVVVTVITLGALVTFFSGSGLAGIIVAVVLLVLNIPPIFVTQHLIERTIRQRRASVFRARAGKRSYSFEPGDRETMS
jgi:peptidoglycan/LPS O-acetylase OafA/YrhL